MKCWAGTGRGGGISRRQFLKAAGGLGLTAAGMGLVEACSGKPASPTSAVEKLETTTIRIPLANVPSICAAPMFVAEDYLKAEGFTDVQYVKSTGVDLSLDALVSGMGDMTMQFSGPIILNLDAGKPITILSGIH